MKRLRLLLFLGIAALSARPAAAQRAFSDGTIASMGSAFCPALMGNVTPVVSAFTGYFAGPSETPPYPVTGDIAYVHAFAQDVSACVNDTVGFEFFLPDGASLAISPTLPVICRRYGNNSHIEDFPGLPSDRTGYCSQTPSTGPTVD